jgi:hypothetical protein
LEVPNARFQLPGTTGVIFPWAPPIGLPWHVLNDLQQSLTTTLVEALRDFVLSRIDESTSNQSSPSLSCHSDYGSVSFVALRLKDKMRAGGTDP